MTTHIKPPCTMDRSPDKIEKAPYRPQYHLSPNEDMELQWQFEKAFHNRWIWPSSTNHGSPFEFVPKITGGLGMCIDYQTVNHITKKDRYPLPHIHKHVQPLGGSTWVSKIDIALGHHEIWIYASNRHDMAFWITYGLCELMLLPVGLANTPSQCIPVINHLLVSDPRQYNTIAVFLSDLLIHSRKTEKHPNCMWIVLNLLQKACLKLERSKYKRFHDDIEFSGV